VNTRTFVNMAACSPRIRVSHILLSGGQ